MHDDRIVRAVLDGMAGDARVAGSDVAGHMPLFYMLAREVPPGEIVELGVNRGWSTLALFAGAVSAGRKLVSYDHRALCRASLARNLNLPQEHEILKSWQFRVKDSVEAAKDFADGSVALWFLDTVHTLEHTRKELAAWLPKMAPSGIMCGHDYLLKEFAGVKYGVKEAVDEFHELHKERFILQVQPNDCGLFILRPK